MTKTILYHFQNHRVSIEMPEELFELFQALTKQIKVSVTDAPYSQGVEASFLVIDEMSKQENPEEMHELVVWDLETTGLDPRTSDIVEIGCAIVKDGEVIETKRWVLDHGKPIPAGITAINGFTDEMVKAEGRPPKECFAEFLAIVRKSKKNLTHNGIRFDIPFLCVGVKNANIEGHTDIDVIQKGLFDRAIDTAALFKGMKLGMQKGHDQSFKEYADQVMNRIVKGLKYNVGVCCDELGIDRSKVTQHRALGDVELTHQIYKKLVRKSGDQPTNG